jgi:hypothetical protein
MRIIETVVTSIEVFEMLFTAGATDPRSSQPARPPRAKLSHPCAQVAEPR